MKPKVTIGICVKNGASTIRDVIESVLTQDYPHELIEVIFVDDGSTDNTLSIIKEYASKMDMQVKIFHHEWKGLGYSRNVVINNTEGKYIIWVDCDMILPKDHVTKQIEFMEKNAKVGIAKAKHGLMETENSIEILENLPFLLYDYENLTPSIKLPGTGGAIFRVETIRQIGGFDNKLDGVGEDQDAAFRMKKAGWFIKRSDAIFFEKRAQTPRAVWKKWFWYGLGNYWLYLKNRKIFSIFGMSPLSGFIGGLLHIHNAYRLVRKKVAFLLPFHLAFQKFAWLMGFTYSRRLHKNRG